MKAAVYGLNGEKKGEVSLPSQFEEPIRFDLIKKAVLAQQSHSKQPHGGDPRAGKKQGKAVTKRRKKYKTTYGHGISRIARKYAWHRGTQFGYIGAFTANAVGGLKVFAPRANKVIYEEINTKERRKAIRSAIAATADLKIVQSRGHQTDKATIIFEDALEAVKKAKDVEKALLKLGLEKEIERVSERKIRPGKGKMRGRRYKTKVGPLLVVSKSCALTRAARNLAGVDVVPVTDLNAELLAPGTQPGRLCIWTKASIEKLGGLFK